MATTLGVVAATLGVVAWGTLGFGGSFGKAGTDLAVDVMVGVTFGTSLGPGFGTTWGCCLRLLASTFMKSIFAVCNLRSSPESQISVLKMLIA